MDNAEGSSSEFDKASIQDTTGVWDQGMFSKGWLGNLRDPNVSLCKTVRRIPSEKVKLPQRYKLLESLPLTNKQLKHIRYRGRIANSEQARDGLLGVLVDHSTGVPVIAGTGRWGSGTQSDPL